MKSAEEEGLVLDRVEREMVLEIGRLTAPYPESSLNLLQEKLTEVLPEVLPEESASLSRYEKLLRPRRSESDGIIENSKRQESLYYEASPPSSFVPEVPTSAETGGKAQEALSQVVQEGALETMWKEVQQGGETSTELLQLEAEISPLKGKLRGAEEVREKQKAEIIKAQLKNGKMMVKRKALTDRRGSPSRNRPSRGFPDPEASSSLAHSEKLLLPRPIETDVIIEGSPRQESSHEAPPQEAPSTRFPPRLRPLESLRRRPVKGSKRGRSWRPG